jgi:hypothetical protein
MNKAAKWILSILGIGLLIFFVFAIIMAIVLDGIFEGENYSKEDLIKNYENNKNQIIEVKRYFKSIIPEDVYVDIEFGKKEIEIFHLKKNGIYDSNWNLNYQSGKTDSLLNELEWSKEQMNILQEKLSKANCISISSGNPITIGWQRSVMGKYFYKVFDSNLDESQRGKYNDNCSFIFYKENIVLEYGGGAIGSQCFPGINN